MVKLFIVFNRGSPPPTRGTRKCTMLRSSNPGITPAYAGNTRIEYRKNTQEKDHPRLRGEHENQYHSQDSTQGSPPPTRGTPVDWKVVASASGITPAYAGNTFHSPPFSLLFWDHPRLRGEHALFNRWERFKQGSPPPTRGTRRT